MPRIEIPYNFKPRWYQEPLMRYMDNGGKRAVWIVHRRGGKDLTAMQQTNKMAHLEKGLYWHIFPTAEQARKALWTGSVSTGNKERIMEAVFPRAIRKSPRDWSLQGEMVVELKCGSVWRLMGSDKMEIVGAGPKGVTFSEFALAKPNTWDLVRPMLRESNGWAQFITTPRGNNHAKKLYDQAGQDKGWFRDLKTVRDTGLTYHSSNGGRPIGWEEMVAEERAEGMPEALIEQEYFCSWSAANVGSFYGILLGLLEARGGVGLQFDVSGDEVFTFWDLGRADDTTIWWMRFREGSTQDAPRVDVLDHYASHGEDLEHYFNVLDERAKVNGWRYAQHVLPHDARAKTLSTRLSVLEQFVDRYGTGMVRIGPELSLRDGIQAVRWLLQKEIRFHPNCSLATTNKDCDGVEALRAYERTWDPVRKVFSETPLHNWSSHTCFVADTLVLTERGQVPIAEVTTADRVWLAQGRHGKVTNAGMVGQRETVLVALSDGRSLECTPDHHVFTTHGLVRADALRHGDGVFTPEEPQWNLSRLIDNAMGLRAAFSESIAASGIGGGRAGRCTCRNEAGAALCACCTASSTPTDAAPSQGTTASFQSIGTGTTSTPTIGSASQEVAETHRQPSTRSKNLAVFGTTEKQAAITRRHMSMAASICTAPSGAPRMARFLRAIMSTTRMATGAITALRTWTSCWHLITRACIVPRAGGLAAMPTNDSWQPLKMAQGLGIDRPRDGAGTVSMESAHGLGANGSRSSASSAVESDSRPIQSAQGSAVEPVRPLLYVVGVRRSGRVVPVYDLTVDHHHAYYANGVLVSNCDAFRGLALYTKIGEWVSRGSRGLKWPSGPPGTPRGEPGSVAPPSEPMREPQTLEELRDFVISKPKGRGRIG
jgi:phage terminase large subunit